MTTEYKTPDGFILRAVEGELKGNKYYFWYAGFEHDDYWFYIEVSREDNEEVLAEVIDRRFFADGDIPRAIYYLGRKWEDCILDTEKTANWQRISWGDMPLTAYKALIRYTLDEIKEIREQIESRMDDTGWSDGLFGGTDPTLN